MAPFNFTSLKSGFFDRDKVIRAVEKGKRSALSKCGAFVRRKAKSLLRYGKGTSAPGSPPTVHRAAFSRTTTNRKTGATKKQPASPLRELIYFAWDGATRSVVIGPEEFRSAKAGPGVAPRSLEKGGPSVAQSRRGPRAITVRPRPFMQPALEAEKAKFPGMFKDSVREA